MDRQITLLIIIALLFFLILYLIPLAYWIIARGSGIKISLYELFIMRIKRIPVKKMISILAIAKQGDITVDLKKMQEHHKSGGDITNVTLGLIAAKTAKIDYNINEAFEDDKRGINIFEKIKDHAKNI